MPGHRHKGHHHQAQPQRLRPHLEPADHRDTVRHQWDHHHRTDQVAPGRRNTQRQFQGIGHHGRLQRKEDEGERGVDQRRDSRSDVAEAGASGQQVHVHPMTGRIHADGQPRQKDDQTGAQDGQRRVDKAVLHQQGRAYRFQHQKGRDAEGRVGHAPFTPAAKALRRVPQRVVLHGLAGHPAVVVATHLDDALRSRLRRRRRSVGGHGVHGFVRVHGA